MISELLSLWIKTRYSRHTSQWNRSQINPLFKSLQKCWWWVYFCTFPKLNICIREEVSNYKFVLISFSFTFSKLSQANIWYLDEKTDVFDDSFGLFQRVLFRLRLFSLLQFVLRFLGRTFVLRFVFGLGWRIFILILKMKRNLLAHLFYSWYFTVIVICNMDNKWFPKKVLH